MFIPLAPVKQVTKLPGGLKFLRVALLLQERVLQADGVLDISVACIPPLVHLAGLGIFGGKYVRHEKYCVVKASLALL